MNIQSPESRVLRDIQTICMNIANKVNSLHGDNINPKYCAADFRSIISKINTLKDYTAKLAESFDTVDNMIKHLDKSPEIQ